MEAGHSRVNESKVTLPAYLRKNSQTAQKAPLGHTKFHNTHFTKIDLELIMEENGP